MPIGSLEASGQNFWGKSTSATHAARAGLQVANHLVALAAVMVDPQAAIADKTKCGSPTGRRGCLIDSYRADIKTLLSIELGLENVDEPAKSEFRH